MAEAHSDLIRDQFTRQATPFSTAAPIADAGALRLIVEAAEAGPGDTVTNLLARSFPNPGDDEKIAALFRASLADDRLGIPLQTADEEIEYAYPVAILAATKS